MHDMDLDQRTKFLSENSQAWLILEKMISPDPYLRDKGLEDLYSLQDFQNHPLIVYVLVTRILDPDLEIRLHAIQMLGKMLGSNSPGEELPENSFRTVTEFTSQMDKGGLIKLLEIGVAYIAAEEAIITILKLCSFAGKDLGGIVNDRRLPVEIRQQAIHFSGEVGFLNTVSAIRNLIQRIEKNRAKSGLFKTRKKYLDEETLYPYALAALAKLDGTID